MVTMAKGSDLMALVAKFEAITKDVNASQWARMDVAAKIYALHGTEGLHVLAQHSPYVYSTLRGYVKLAQAIKPALRRQFADVAPDLFHVALASAHKFSSHSPKGRVSYWLQLAQDKHLNRRDLQHEADQTVLMTQLNSSSADQARQDELTRRVQAAQQHLRHINEIVNRFNRQDAPYALFTLSITRTAYGDAH